MKATKTYLQFLFWIPVIIAITIALLYETETLIAGPLTDDKQLDYLAAIVMELAAIGLIPLALRMFKFKAIDNKLKAGKERALKTFGTVRILLLGIPLVIDTLLYYLLMNATFGYLALIILLCMAFIYPTAEKCEYETLGNNSQL